MQQYRWLTIALVVLAVSSSCLAETVHKNNNNANHNVDSANDSASDSRSLTSSDDDYYYDGDALERITCPSSATMYESWVMVDLHGKYLPWPYQDYGAELGNLLMNSYRTATALHCDPLQRILKVVEYSQCGSTGQVIFRVEVLASGKPQLLFEPIPPNPMTFTKESFGEVCHLSAVLDPTPMLHGVEDECPFLGCYCPSNMLPPSVKTTGVTQEYFASMLSSAIQECQGAEMDYYYDDVDYYYEGSGKKEGGKGGRRRGRRLDSGCLPGVRHVSSVTEIKPVHPCDKRRHFESVIVTTVSQDPCTTDPSIFKNFVDELVKEYNSAQFNACDGAQRQIEAATLIDICSHHVDYSKYHRLLKTPNTGFPLPWRTSLTSVSRTSNEVTRRRRAGRRHLEDIQENVEDNSTTDATFTTDAPFLRRMYVGDVKPTHPKPKEHPKCFCPATSKKVTDGIWDDEFLAIAESVMEKVSKGCVAVTDQFEANEGCPDGKKKVVRGAAAVMLNVDFNCLSTRDIEQIEQDCVLAYNNYVMEYCPASYTQLRKCRIHPAKYYDGTHSGHDSKNNVVFVNLFGDAFIDPHGNVDPVLALGRNTDIEIDPNPVSTLSLKKHFPKFVTTLPCDLCLCEKGSGTGKSPTADVFATFLNQTGVVASAIVAEPAYCTDPQYNSQTICAEVTGGDLSNPMFQGKLEQYLQDTLNTMYIEMCVDHHFYVYSMELVWWEAQEHVYALKFAAKFISYNNGPEPISLFTMNNHHGRALSSSWGNNKEGLPVVRKIVEEDEVLRQLPYTEAACFCMAGAHSTAALELGYLNDRLSYGVGLIGANHFAILE